jgi:hypothetical protein
VNHGSCAECGPDIYLLLLDGYPRADVLAEAYDVDDTTFLEGLQARGFSVASRSHSNYPTTALSLMSMLWMRHVGDIDLIADSQAAGVAQGSIIRRVLNEAPSLDLLREHGYEVVATSSGFEQVGLREADRFLDVASMNEFEVQWAVLSGVARLLEPLQPDFLGGQWRSRVEGTIDLIGEVASEPHAEPRFVLGHIPSPHAPWIHREDGSARFLRDPANVFQETEETAHLTRAELIDAFAGQVKYIRAQATQLVDRILESSSRPTIIAVFSDHGTAFAMEEGGYEGRLRNLMAVRASDGQVVLDDEETLIRLLPLVLGQALDLRVPPVPTTLYQWDSGDDLLALSPVR